jgi:RNA polymerase subunit RPABC4/transcription elongation factor Spt4
MEHSMAEAYEVLIPLLNPNEPEVQIVEKLVENGQKVVVDDVLCKVETTKSSHELTAEWAGYIVSFDTDQGDKLRAGQRLCWVILFLLTLIREISFAQVKDCVGLPKRQSGFRLRLLIWKRRG